MRKYLSLLLAALSVACAKETQREAEVVFSLGVPSGQITRATTDGIAAALSACTPAGPFSLSAKSQTNELRTYAVTTGEALTMAVDSYAVTGSGEGRFLSNITLGVASTSPAWAVNATVSVDGDGELSVPANYTCLALVFDKAKTEKITLGGASSDVAVSAMGGNDEYGVVFVKYSSSSWYRDRPLWVYVFPTDKVYGDTAIYKFVSGNSDGFINARYGYWYLLQPGEVDVASGQFGIEFPAWKEGE